MNNHNTDCSCMSESTEADWTEPNWIEAEARFQRAKQVLLDIQQQHCAAAHELLVARARVRKMLEAVFPGEEEISHLPVSAIRLAIRDNCNQAAA